MISPHIAVALWPHLLAAQPISDKITKSAAGYTQGKPDEDCSLCRYFSRETCKIVAGHIDPDAWCRYWEASSR